MQYYDNITFMNTINTRKNLNSEFKIRQNEVNEE